MTSFARACRAIHRFRASLRLCGLFGGTSVLLALGCSAGSAPARDAGFSEDAAAVDAALDGDASDPDAGTAPPFLSELAAESSFNLLAGDAVGGEVKYLARVQGAAPIEPLHELCYFQNTPRYPWHVQFLQEFSSLGGALTFDQYRAWVLRKATRRLWGGTLRRWPDAKHPTRGDQGLFTYDVYSEVNGLDVAALAEVDQQLKQCIPFARDRLVWVAGGDDQEALLMRERANLEQRGIVAVRSSDLIAGLSFVPYTRGEGYGYLRIVPRGQGLGEYGPRDIVAVESAPQDISIVAGLLSEKPQNELGHVNLRLREKGTPNAALPELYQTAWIAALDGKLVHLVVGDELTLTAADPAEAEAFWAAHRPTVRPPSADLTRTELAPLTGLRASDALAYGAKCANLGELTRVLEPAHRPDGFGIPFVRYRDFVRNSGLESQVETLIQMHGSGSDAKAKRGALKALRDALRAAPFDPQLLAEIKAAIEARFGSAGLSTYLRFRSSTNVEDLDAFTGAGLYESKSGCLADDLDGDTTGPSACLKPDKAADLERQRAARQQELAEHPERGYLRDILDDIEGDLSDEKPVADALRKVWASLWNERAFDERAYYGIDHRLAYMAVAVHPTYALERANAVVVSNLHVDDGPPLYRVNSQVGELSVVTPEDPNAVAELLTFRRQHEPPEATDIRVQLGSSLLPSGAEVWPRDKLLELAQLIFRVHDHFASEVYPQLSPLSLDFEVKLEQSGEVAIKQVRPYVSMDP